jgi:signal transduction histidine kinase
VQHDTTISLALDAARRLSGMDVSYIGEFRDGAEHFRPEHLVGDNSGVGIPLDGSGIPLPETYCQRVVDGRIDGIVRDAPSDPELAGLACCEDVRSYLGVPLRLPDGRLYGTLCCASSDAQPELDAEQLDTLRILGQVVSSHLATTTDAERRRRAQDELLESVSHDLRTPLAAIRTLAEDLAADADDPLFPPAEAGRLIVREASRTLALVEDLLLVARERAGAVVAERTSTDLARLCLDSARAAALAAGAAEGRVVVDVPRGSLRAEVDPVRVRQALQNLLDNALKYSPEGGTVHLGCRTEGSTVVLTVSDEGIGIHPEDVERLGERFFRARSAADAGIGGIGIGLATVRSVVAMHEGTLEVASQLGHGSTFTLRLPLAHAPNG